jgi:hypothetical protein
LLTAYEEQGRSVSVNPGPTFAPAVFERDDDAESVTRAALAKAMGRLLKAGRVHVETIGPPSKRRAKLTPGPDPTKAQPGGQEDAR